MKFNWKVEDMYLMNHRGAVCFGSYRPFPIEFDMNRDEKIEVIDSRNDGMMTYLLGLTEKFKADEPTMKRDKWDNIATVSLKAWIKRNDPKHAIDDSYRHGKIRTFRTERYIYSMDRKGPYDHLDDFVDEVFHRELLRMYDEEVAYFKTVDPYEVAKKTLSDNVNQFNTTLGPALCFSSTGEITIDTGKGAQYRPAITLEECNYLNSKFEELKKLMGQLTDEVTQAFSTGCFTFNSDNGGDGDGSKATD